MGKKEVKQSVKLRRDLIGTIIVTLIAAGVTVAAVISVAWFSNNRQTTATGAGVSVLAERYVLSFVEGGNAGKYETFRQKIDGYTGSEHEEARVWLVNSDYNLLNSGDGQFGIHPNYEGEITFYITPKVESIDLKFHFLTEGYIALKQKGENVFEPILEGALTTDTVSKLVKASSLHDEDKGASYYTDIEKFLLGHIMLFEKVGDGENDLIPLLPDENGERVLEKTFTGIGTKHQVTLFWRWPLRLNEIIDMGKYNQEAGGTLIIPNVGSLEYTADPGEGDPALTYYQLVEKNVLEHPEYYMKGVTYDSSLTVSAMAGQHRRYGDYYDLADNDIGNVIDFMLLRLILEEPRADSTPEEGGEGG